MKDLLVAALMVAGGVFMLIAAIGVLRMPDLYIRMHAASKTGTVGVIGLILALAIHSGDLGVITRVLLISAFFLLTAPIGAHMIGRAAYRSGVPLWRKSVRDEWRERSDKVSSVSMPKSQN